MTTIRSLSLRTYLGMMLVICWLGLAPASGVLMQGPAVCDGTETPCDPLKPWMRGQIEKACSYDGHPIDGDMAAEWHACRCQHVCDPTDPNANETDGRKWDAHCNARCSPRHCHCTAPCGEGSE